MSMRCDFCDKGKQFGNRVSHAKNRVKRVFKPNLRRKRLLVEGQIKPVKICMKCLKLVKNNRNPKVKPLPIPVAGPISASKNNN